MLDPIDGTTNYAFGQHLWGVTVALLRQGKIVAGTIAMPEVDMHLAAEEGRGCSLNGRPLPPLRPGPVLPHEPMGHGTAAHISRFERFAKARHLGAFVAEAAYVCTQGLRAMTTGRVKLYDAAAGILMVRELGGLSVHLDGGDYDEARWMKDDRCPPLYLGPTGHGLPLG